MGKLQANFVFLVWWSQCLKSSTVCIFFRLPYVIVHCWMTIKGFPCIWYTIICHTLDEIRSIQARFLSLMACLQPRAWYIRIQALSNHKADQWFSGITWTIFYNIEVHVPIAWWRHQMGTFSALLALCEGNPPVTGGFPSQRPVTRSFDVFFDLRWTNGRANNRDAGDLRHRRDHYDITVITYQFNIKRHYVREESGGSRPFGSMSSAGSSPHGNNATCSRITLQYYYSIMLQTVKLYMYLWPRETYGTLIQK